MRRLLIFTLAVAPTACVSKSSPDGAPSGATQRHARCERIAGQAAQLTSMVGLGLAASTLDGEASPEKTKQARAEMAEVAKEARAEIHARCMKWPEEALRCFEGLGALDPECERIVAQAMGEPVSPTDVSSGPPPVWKHTLPAKPQIVRVLPDGSVLAMVMHEVEVDGSTEYHELLLRVRDDKELWRVEADFRHWLISSPAMPDVWVTASREDIIGYDADDGHERFRVALPAYNPESGESKPLEKLDEDSDWDWEKAWPQVAASSTPKLLIGDSVGRFWRVDVPACEKPEKKGRACLVLDGVLPGEDFGADDQLFVLDDGSRVLVEYENLRVFDEAWKTRVDIRAYDLLGPAAAAGDRVVALIDDDVIMLDLDACAVEHPFAPSSFPQKGRMYIRGDDECEDCGPVPAGCVAWQHYVSEAHAQPFALMGGALAVVHGEDGTFGVADGQVRWKLALGGGGRTVARGQHVFAIGTGLDEGDPFALWKLDASGTVQWKSDLPFEETDWIYSTDDLTLDVTDGWIVAGYENRLAVFEG